MSNQAKLSAFAFVFTLATTSGWYTPRLHAGIISINFDDGTGAGAAIDDFYQSLGITFSDAAWSDGFNGRPGTSPTFQLGSLSTLSLPKATNPIIGVFSNQVDMVSISAIDVGFNDARLDAYDSAIGGNLIASSTFEGVTMFGNSLLPQDTGILTVAVSGIRRVELYQPKSDIPNDGVLFDNLSFNVVNAVPEPSSCGLFLALSGSALFTRSHRQHRRSKRLKRNC